jgi:hypothetical protein
MADINKVEKKGGKIEKDKEKEMKTEIQKQTKLKGNE